MLVVCWLFPASCRLSCQPAGTGGLLWDLLNGAVVIACFILSNCECLSEGCCNRAIRRLCCNRRRPMLQGKHHFLSRSRGLQSLQEPLTRRHFCTRGEV